MDAGKYKNGQSLSFNRFYLGIFFISLCVNDWDHSQTHKGVSRNLKETVKPLWIIIESVVDGLTQAELLNWHNWGIIGG